MARLIQFIRNIASGALDAGLLSVTAHSEERLSELRLDQLSPEQQTMATMLATPPRNNKINIGPFNAYARAAPRLAYCSFMSAILFASTARCRPD
jgi:hypothetical protein